jgi:hypothetical protein
MCEEIHIDDKLNDVFGTKIYYLRLIDVFDKTSLMDSKGEGFSYGY